jgi:hypothetical protein
MRDPVPLLPHANTNWTIINLDPTLNAHDIKSSLNRHGISVADVLDGYNNVSGYCTYVTFDDHTLTNPTGTITIPMGIQNFTLTIINEHDDSVARRGSKIIGGNYYLRSDVIHLSSDSDADLSIRILHEIDHGLNLDADGMYTTSRVEFQSWMDSVNYPYSDYYYERSTKYRTLDGRYGSGYGAQVNLDYHLWLYNMSAMV